MRKVIPMFFPPEEKLGQEGADDNNVQSLRRKEEPSFVCCQKPLLGG